MSPEARFKDHSMPAGYPGKLSDVDLRDLVDKLWADQVAVQKTRHPEKAAAEVSVGYHELQTRLVKHMVDTTTAANRQARAGSRIALALGALSVVIAAASVIFGELSDRAWQDEQTDLLERILQALRAIHLVTGTG